MSQSSLRSKDHPVPANFAALYLLHNAEGKKNAMFEHFYKYCEPGGNSVHKIYIMENINFLNFHDGILKLEHYFESRSVIRAFLRFLISSSLGSMERNLLVSSIAALKAACLSFFHSIFSFDMILISIFDLYSKMRVSCVPTIMVMKTIGATNELLHRFPSVLQKAIRGEPI